MALEPAVEPKDERHMKLSHQGELGDLWKKAGLINVREQALVIDQAYSSFKDYWEPFTKGAGPGGRVRRVAFRGSSATARSPYAQALAWRSPRWSIHAETLELGVCGGKFPIRNESARRVIRRSWCPNDWP